MNSYAAMKVKIKVSVFQYNIFSTNMLQFNISLNEERQTYLCVILKMTSGMGWKRLQMQELLKSIVVVW